MNRIGTSDGRVAPRRLAHELVRAPRRESSSGEWHEQEYSVGLLCFWATPQGIHGTTTELLPNCYRTGTEPGTELLKFVGKLCNPYNKEKE